MLASWAARHGVSPAALHELRCLMGVAPSVVTPAGAFGSEASVQASRRIELAKHGIITWRNNVGAGKNEAGAFMRWGLANDSPAVNRVFKSSDLIGIRPTACPCGRTYGVFVAEETKHPGWKYVGDKPCSCKPHKPQCKPCHERGQLNFLNFVIAKGGIARFITGGEPV